jgi:monofunctional biosynthetic peptidoglycan transglycosylase
MSIGLIKMKKNFKILFKKIGISVLKVMLILFLFSLMQVLLLKWINPMTSSVILQRQIASLFTENKKIKYEWYNYDEISKEIALAVIAAEDQNFPKHFGFDFEQIDKALRERKEKGRLRGASTITQQAAKNLFLWEGRNFIRKGLEVYFTILIEMLWSKQRILEIYLNIAEMGDGIFGIGAASKIYFGKTPGKLSKDESVRIAVVLPNPVKYSVKSPSNYIRERQVWILDQMESLGGVLYIKNL